MADPVQNLTFLSWTRERISGLATAQSGGRAQAAAPITLTARGPDGGVTGSETRALPFFFAGPADIAGLNPAAIVRRYPAPGTVDHESDRCPYIEVADPSFPWRYTPAVTPPPTNAGLHPWLVLLVGEEGTELTLGDGRVTIDVSAQAAAHTLGAPSAPYRFAHVQADASGHRTARVLSGRPLQAGTDYLAVVVPAYDESGARSWTGAAPVTVPVYDAWRFRTAVPAGSFEDLAARLRPGDAPATTGRAPLRYPRLPDAPPLEVLGALVAVSPEGPAVDPPLPPVIAQDLAAQQLPARDPEGRPIVALPRYGDAWNPAAPTGAEWGRRLNRDPRHRGVAGLGLEVGIRFQDELVTDVLAHLGALQEARQRIGHAVLGVAVSRSLWHRRVPAAPVDRLWLLGPSLARLATERGTVARLATAEDRAIARGTFSTAARRVLRSGPARTTIAGTRPEPSAILAAVNRLPAAPPSTTDGLPLDRVALANFDEERRRTILAGNVPPARLLAAANALVNGADARLQPVARDVVTAMRDASQAGRAVPWGQALAMLAASDASVIGRRRDPDGAVRKTSSELQIIRDRFTDRADDADLTGLLGELSSLTPNDPPVAPVEIGAMADVVAAAFDPTTARPPILERVLGTIKGGIDPEQPLAPPEPCVGLDRAAWADVERAFDEWLLPGVGQLPQNSVISLETNPVFIDAFLAGLNTQLLSELRWRNVPIATGCTPIRRFWDRADTSNGARADDIVGLASWTLQSTLGDAAHLAPGKAARELVIAVRGDLFLRYPATLVYLKSARHGSPGAIDFDIDPDDNAPRILPGFQGRLGGDVAFFGFPSLDASAVVDHWVVFEEPPAGYKFANDVQTAATTGHAWAAATLAQPVRVLIRGDSLIAGSQP
jgi:hypothetical protein